MPARLNFLKAPHDVQEAMMNLQGAVSSSGLEESLLHLTYLLVSRINGCAYCIDMHSKDLRAAGESELRIDLVSVWDEVDGIYSDRERAAFAWAEAVTKVSETHVPDEVFEHARQHFSEAELAKLNLAIVAINAWNRFSIAFRAEPGHYQPGRHPLKESSAA